MVIEDAMIIEDEISFGTKEATRQLVMLPDDRSDEARHTATKRA